MKRSIFLFCVAFSISSWSISGHASDLAKEKRWAEQVVDSLLVGNAVDLETNGNKVLGIYTPASPAPTGRAAIIAHGIGAHPNWQDVVYPLRTELPEQGWSTLSIQMPVLANDADTADYQPLFGEVGPRVEAAVAYLKEQGDDTIVLIGHSLGASMATTYVAENADSGIDGLVAVGMSVIEIENMNAAAALEKISLPVLDLYGSRDLETVRDTAAQRAAASAKAKNENYRQLEIEGADHFFVGVEDSLVSRVYGWLKSQFEKGQ